MIHFEFNADKAAAALFFASETVASSDRETDTLRISKILYFAEQKHLARYGRPIVGGTYIALPGGPVLPEIFECLNGSADYPEELSTSDLECVEESIREHQGLSAKELIRKSRDAAWASTAPDCALDYAEIAKLGGADDATVEYVRLQSGISELMAAQRHGRG